MRQRLKPPISSFGPEILSALIAGSRAPVRLELSYRNAVRMRQRLYQLRQRMKEEEHEAATAVQRCFITIEWPPGTPVTKNYRNVEFPRDRDALVTLVLSPQDNEFAAALNKAGVKAHELSTEAVVVEEPADVLKDYIQEAKHD